MLPIGTVLAGRYEMLEQIGSGGMSVVFRGLDHKLNRVVAIKVMKEDFINDTVQVEKFHKEAWAIAMLTHPNIAGVYDIGTEQGLEYMIKEYVDGITLKEYIRRRRHMTSDEIVKVTLKIAEGLKTAHENNVIHRDIKPQNILVTPKGEVKVTDFGIAKFAKSLTTTEHKDAMGSVHYLSPEQARGLRVDGRCDLYALGITMFEMATGHPPFDGDTPVAVALKQINSPLPSVRAEVPELWPGLEAIIIGLTQKNPDDRYQDAASLIADLTRVYNDPHHGGAGASKKTAGAVNNGQNANGYSRTTEQNGQNGRTSVQTGPYNMRSQPYYVYRPTQNVPQTPVQTGPLKQTAPLPQPPKKQEKSFWGKHSVAILGTVLGLLIVALAVVVILGVHAFNTGRTYDYAMPNFAGQTVEQARSRIASLDLQITIGDDYELVFDDTVPKGQIISQSHKAGTTVSASEAIDMTVVVSKGPKPVDAVESYLGGVYEDVIAELSTKGIPYQVEVTETGDASQNGLVVAQTPDPGTPISSSTNITLTVAYLKNEFVTVPDLTNKTEPEVMDLLESQELQIGSVTESYSSDVEEGRVIAQDLKAGSRVLRGTEISVTLSMGPYEGSETQVVGAFLINEELLGHITQDEVEVYAYAVVDGMRQDLIDQTYTRQEILDSRMLLKYYQGTTEIHVFVNSVEVFSQLDMGE